MQGTKETEELLKNIEAVVSGEKVSAESPKRKNKVLNVLILKTSKSNQFSLLSLLFSPVDRRVPRSQVNSFMYFLVYKQ